RLSCFFDIFEMHVDVSLETKKYLGSRANDYRLKASRKRGFLLSGVWVSRAAEWRQDTPCYRFDSTQNGHGGPA
ncbi:hypothetical protein ACLBVF_34050, partial [Pseudomonas aeruginosa]|uniref:hypothetical protein n=1 Tax=Pseudomonas aeruginosa TaxID=287 RepID=UPI00396942D8